MRAKPLIVLTGRKVTREKGLTIRLSYLSIDRLKNQRIFKNYETSIIIYILPVTIIFTSYFFFLMIQNNLKKKWNDKFDRIINKKKWEKKMWKNDRKHLNESLIGSRKIWQGLNYSWRGARAHTLVPVARYSYAGAYGSLSSERSIVTRRIP